MFSKFIVQITHRKFSSFFLVLMLLAASGCQSGFLGEQRLTTAENAPVAPSAPPAPIVVDGTRTSYADVVGKTSPAVVRIESEIKERQTPQTQMPQSQMPQSPFDDFFNNPQTPPGQQQQRPQIQRGLGSGVIVSADGYILTNNHVVEGAEKITVLMSDNKSYTAKAVGLDKPSDLAVLKIEDVNLPFLNLGNSDNVRVGDIVLAIGNPLGIGQTVTAGIISAKGRRTGLSDGNSFEDFLQTDAPINRGNSGGALVNLTGELIGINSQILSSGGQGGSIGIGFSIPSNMAKTVMEQLIANGKVKRGLLGINIQNITEDVAKSLDLKNTKGVIVSNVRPASAADKAGIKRGDIVLAINGEAIEDSNILRNKVAQSQPGSEIKIKVLRDGKEQEFTATLDEFATEGEKADNKSDGGGGEPNGGKQPESGKLGLNLQPLTPQISRQLELPADVTGVVVTDVYRDGAAAQQGVDRGDVIIEINRQPVGTLEEVKTALDKSGDKPILLLISRRGQTIYLTVKPN